MQEKLALAITGAVKVSLDESESESFIKRSTDNVEAYELFLKAIKGLETYSLETSTGFLKDVIKLDPEFSYAYSMLSFIEMLKGDIESGRKHAERALEFNEKDTLAYMALARSHLSNQEYDAAEEMFKRGRYYSNDSGMIKFYATYLRNHGRYNEALSDLKQALKVDPFSIQLYAYIIAVCNNLGKYEEAKAYFEKANTIFPDNQYIHMHLARLYNRTGEHEKAVDIFSRFDEPYRLGITYAIMGNHEKAREYIELTISNEAPDNILVFKAIMRAWIGETEESLDILEQVYEQNRTVLNNLKCDFEFDPLREEPRFKALMKKMGLPED
ncbi:tetratricopeptide repeat protein [Candidatus Latescibacterota bacterium]